MKKQKLFLSGGLFLAMAFLSGCGTSNDGGKAETPMTPAATSQKTDAAKAPETAVPAADLPEAVSTQPGANVDAEVKNIDNDLKAINDNSLNAGMSDKELGL